MTNIDQYESVFKSASKSPFLHEPVDIRSILVVTDSNAAETRQFADSAKTFLTALENQQSCRWEVIKEDDFSGVDHLLEVVRQHQPDLICTYRNLQIPATQHPYSLGVYVDVLTQATSIPVLLMPHPKRPAPSPDRLRGTQSVMAIADHLTGDHHLVSFAVQMTASGGTLFLSHVEDSAMFERYMTTIGKISTIDTENARHEILEQLLKEPHDYIRSCCEILAAEGLPLKIEEIVTLGHHMSDYKRLMEEHEVNLLVLNTKDEDQLAMHGMAYPLSVELRDTPMLLL